LVWEEGPRKSYLLRELGFPGLLGGPFFQRNFGGRIRNILLGKEERLYSRIIEKNFRGLERQTKFLEVTSL